MRKIAVILLTFVTMMLFTACTSNGDLEDINSSNIGSNSTTQEITTSQNNTDDSETGNVVSSNQETNLVESETKILVAYFSATNTTEEIANYAAESMRADLYEIIPQEPYTDADLNYNDDNSRSSIEMNDPSSRPAISGSVENMDQYDIVFIGYPIWWGEAPRIMNTFMESYDFSGKTIVPFCTSGGSGIGSSAENLEQLTKDTNWLQGQRFNGSTSREEIVEWIDSLGLDIIVK